MRRFPHAFVLTVLMVAASIVPAAAQTSVEPPEHWMDITSSRRARVAIPDFATTGGDAALGRTIAEVLWNDLDFEREFVMMPRDDSTDADAAAPDAVIQGTVDVRSGVATVEVRLVPVGKQEPLFARRYTGSTANPRAFAHTIADQIHEQALLYVTR